MQSNLRRKKLRRMNHSCDFLGGSFSNRDNDEPQSNLEEKVNPRFVKGDFYPREDPTIFTSIAPVLLDWSNETSLAFPALKSTSHFLPQPSVS